MKRKKKTGLVLGICVGVLAIGAVGVGTGVAVKVFQEKNQTEEEYQLPEEADQTQQESEVKSEEQISESEEQKADPVSYTSETIQAGEYVVVEYPVFSGGAYPEAVQRLNERLKSEAEGTASEQEVQMQSFLEEAEEMGMDISLSFERSLKNVYIEENMICVEQSDYAYTGGAHGSAGVSGFNYDLETERELSLEEVLGCSREDAVEAAVLAFSRTELVQENIITLDQVRESLDQASYCMTPEGLHMVFPQYSLGAYAIGMPEATVTQQDVNDARG